MVKKIFLFAASAVLTLGMNGCNADVKADVEFDNIAFSILYGTDYINNGSFTTKSHKVITNQSDYDEELLNYLTTQDSTIDFTTSNVLLVDMGQRNSGGYAIEVTKVEEYDDYAMATVKLTKPGENCTVSEALTNPFKFVEIPSKKELLITEELSITTCN